MPRGRIDYQNPVHAIRSRQLTLLHLQNSVLTKLICTDMLLFWYTLLLLQQEGWLSPTERVSAG